MAHQTPIPFNPAQGFDSTQQAIKLIMQQPTPHESLMAVLNANILVDEFGFASELIKEYGCYEPPADTTAQSDMSNRIFVMPEIEITMYWKDFIKANPDFREHAPETRFCKIGIYPDDPTDDEEASDQDIFYYFESLEAVTQGDLGACDFIVISYVFDGQTVEIPDADIQKQLQSDDPILNSMVFNEWRGLIR